MSTKQTINDIIDGLLYQTKNGDIEWKNYNSIFESPSTIRRRISIDGGYIYIEIRIDDTGHIKESYIHFDYNEINNGIFYSSDYESINEISEIIIKKEGIGGYKTKEDDKYSSLKSIFGKREMRNRKIDEITNNKNKGFLSKMFNKK